MNRSMPHRSCYVNFAEHLQNRWNPNIYYPTTVNRWTNKDWESFLNMLKAFGYNVFEFWVPPTLFSPQMTAVTPENMAIAETFCGIIETAHSVGLKTKFICTINTIGKEWYFACPKDHTDHALILSLWKHWANVLCDIDIIGFFPGDPGGCNRNGCTHQTYVDLALELTGVIREVNPGAWVEVNTWGTPFAGWGEDLRHTPGWDGSFAMLNDQQYNTPEVPCHIWNGRPQRAHDAMEYLIKRLPMFPKETMVGINLGFSPDGDAQMGGDARQYAREIASVRPIVSWDYSASEGELINYPHWRLPRMAARRREEAVVAPYQGGMVYTMSPKLNLLTLYAGAQFLLDPDARPDTVSRQFCAQVFGSKNEILGELFEAFEVVKGWGHYPRRQWSKAVLRKTYAQIIDRLEAVDPARCTLPIFPVIDEYRDDLLWFARMFLSLAQEDVDRTAIRREYRNYALKIYDFIPQSVDERTHAAMNGFSRILEMER